MKVCNECLLELPLDKFGTDRRRKDGYNLKCKKCINARKRELSTGSKDYTRTKVQSDDLGRRQCSACKIFKDIDDFGKNKSTKTGLSYYCKSCASEKTIASWRKHQTPEKDQAAYEKRKQWYIDNPREAWGRNLAKFGITPDDYDAMFETQNGVCAICKKPQPDGRYKRLAVDHDHETGAVRGLLCTGCNTMIGRIENKAYLMPDYISYLFTHSRVEIPGLSEYLEKHDR